MDWTYNGALSPAASCLNAAGDVHIEYLEADMICAFRFDRTSEGPKRIAYSFVYNLLVRALLMREPSKKEV